MGEFAIFTGIAVFCVLFGSIVLLFRKKLEVLTHGVEERSLKRNIMSQNSTDQFFKSTVLGHPSGLFVLFFTEMWERFFLWHAFFVSYVFYSFTVR